MTTTYTRDEYMEACRGRLREVAGVDEYGVDPAWSDAFRRRLAPKVAVRLGLHYRPLAKVEGEQLQCPVCKAVGAIVEFDKAVREHELHVEDGAVHVSRGEGDFHTDRFACQVCGVEVRMPLEMAYC